MRPAEIEQLIEDLKDEKSPSGVVAQADGKTIVLIEDTEARYVFDASEAKLLFGSPASVRRFFEAIDYPEEVFVELHGVEIDHDTMSELEKLASTVDEM